MISVAILGPVEVCRDGERLAVPAGKTTEVLMYLALAGGTTVRTERLFEDLWGGEAAVVGKNALQSKVSQLRRALGDPLLVLGRGTGYTLALDPDAVDALHVTRLADEAAAFRQAGEASATDRACSSALALYRGESLFDASDAEWLMPHRAHFEALRLRLVEHQLGARMDLGASGEVISELETLADAYPLREGFSALLMTALYRDGRQAEALAAYRRVREQLAEELGLDPSPDLQKLEQRILVQDPSLDPPTGARSRPALSVSGGNLPPLSSTMVGRDRELCEIGERIEAHRLTTLVGAAGVGKTRLALEVARRASPSDGAWLVRLENAPTSDSVIETVADALHATGATLTSLAERLRGADVLLVLDNCEHVIDAVAELIEPLLSTGPDVRILATSQVQIGIDGESVYGIEPLTFDDSLALFALRAGEHGQALAQDGDTATTLEEVCRSLDGLPLAIELAAARTKSLSLGEISQRLDDRFSLLMDPTSRRPMRQRRLSAAIGWSYDLLFPDDQSGLWALACFVGGAPLPAVERVLKALGVPEQAAVDVVSRLVDRSLVKVDTAADGMVRYRLLDSVRSYARDRMEEAGCSHVAFGAHAAWIASAASIAARGAKGPDQAEHVAFGRRERSNIDAALAWASVHDPSLAVTIADDLGWAWVVLGDALGAQRLRGTLAAADAVIESDQRISVLLACAWLEASAGDLEDARAAVAEARKLLEPETNAYLCAKVEWYTAYVVSQEGRPDDSLDALARSRIVFQELQCSWEEAAGWVLAAHCEGARGDPAAAHDSCVEAARQLELVGDPWLLIHVEAMLGSVAQAQHHFDEACEHLARAAARAEQLGFAATEAYHLANLGRAQQQAGDLLAAANTLRRAIDVARATGDLRVTALARTRLSRVLLSQGDTDAARPVLQAAHRWYHESGGGDGARLADYLLASLDASQGRADAPARLESILAEARASGDTEVEVLCLDALALSRAHAGDTSGAVDLLESADSLLPAARHHVTDADRSDADDARRLIGLATL